MEITIYEGPREFIDVASGLLVLVSTRAVLIYALGLEFLLVPREVGEAICFDLPVLPGDVLLSASFKLVREQDPGGA